MSPLLLTVSCGGYLRSIAYCHFSFPQYGQLVRDIDNYLHTVMSDENVTKLLRKLTKSQQKTSLILSVLQEVELWERTQDKFVAMLEEENPLYRDVVTPFTVAVFQVWNFDLMQMHFEYGNADSNNIMLARLAQLIACLGLCSEVYRLISGVRHILLLVVSYW